MPSPTVFPGTVGHAYMEFKDPSKGSDKAYNLTLFQKDGGWMVVAEHGKATLPKLTLSPKTPSPVPYPDALDLFNKTYKEKTGRSSEPYTVVSEKLPPTVAPAMSTTASSSEDVLDILRRTLDPMNPRKKPVLLEGLPGTSKTYSVNEFAKTGGFHKYSLVQGHSGVEASDLLGSMVLNNDGSMIWVDGPVTSAFREAAKGRKALLFFDELGRIPRRERGLLLTALSPHDGHYYLRTGRAIDHDPKEGLAKMEMIAAPVANLSIVAATNSGSNYADVELDDDAGKERWRIVHLKYDDDRLKKIIESRLTDRGWPTTLADDFMDLRAKIKTIHNDRFCEKELTPRLTMDVIDMSEGQSRPDIARAARQIFPALTGRTPEGEIIPEQQQALEKAVDAFEKGPRKSAKV